MKFEIDKKKLNETKKLINIFLRKGNTEKIKSITEKFGLKYNINFDIEIVSSELKYIFNYLSGGFGNADIKCIDEFLNGSRFGKAIKHFSGRAIYDKKIVKKVMVGLSYLENSNSDFVPILKNLCSNLITKLENRKSIILIGVSRDEEIMPFDRLLAHEIFHLVLFDNKIVFEKINKKYSYLDEGLAIFLSYVWSGNVKKILEIKNNFDRKAAIFWYKKLLLVQSGKEIDKIKEIYMQYNDK